MAMTDLRESSKPDPDAKADEYAKPAYDYGLQVRLCDDQLEKMGIDNMPPVGSTLIVTCKMLVTGVRVDPEIEPGGDDSAERSLCLTITAMDLGDQIASGRATRLYGGQ